MSVRREERITAYKYVRFHGFEDPRGASSMDFSRSGIGIVTVFRLSEGESHIISCSDFWPVPRRATVVWIRPEGPTSLRAGMSIIH